MRTVRTSLGSMLATAVLASPAVGQSLLTSNTLVGATTIGFSSLTPNTFPASTTIGGVTITPVGDTEFYVIGTYGLLSNGGWDSGGGPANGVGTSFGPGSFMRFTFATPVGAAGGFVNYCAPVGFANGCNGDAATMRAFDVGGSLIASYDVDLLAPIVTPGATNGGAFRGIDGGGTPIAYLEWGGEFVVMGDLSYSATTAIPEPASLVLLATGLVGIGAVARRRKA